jgi:TPR repeat protein
MKKILTVLFLSLFFAGAAYAEAPIMPDDILKAARAGDPEAQLEMGILYEYGYRMKDNKVEALAWYMKAADLGNSRAATYRDRLMKSLSPTQVDRARDKAAALKTAPAAPPTQ